jgi:hypothetical protein
MTTVARQALTSQRPVERCALCGRPIRADAKVVPLIGKVGDTCYHRVAAIEGTLQKLGLTPLLEGTIEFEPEPGEDAHGVSSYVFPEHIQKLMNSAEKLGFRFEWEWTTCYESARCRIVLPRGAELRRRVWARTGQWERAVGS